MQILYKYYKQYTFIYSYNYLAKGSQGVKYKYSTISFFRGKKNEETLPMHTSEIDSNSHELSHMFTKLHG